MLSLHIIFPAVFWGVAFISSVGTQEFVDLGTVEAVVGSSARLEYISDDQREIQICTWSQASNTQDAPLNRKPIDIAEGKCVFTIDKVEKRHSSVWNFVVVFKKSFRVDRSDLHIKGQLRLHVVDPVSDSVEILDVGEVLTLVDSRDPENDNKSIPPLICCSETQKKFVGEHQLQFYLDKVVITESRPAQIDSSDSFKTPTCIEWFAAFDWKDDGKKIVCQKTDNGNTVNPNLQDSLNLKIIYGPRILLPAGNLKDGKVIVNYPTQPELKINFASNTELSLSWYSVIEKNEYDEETRLDPMEFSSELRRLTENQFEAVLNLTQISTTRMKIKPFIIRLRLSNKYKDWRQVDFDINFETGDQPRTATTAWPSYSEGESQTKDSSTVSVRLMPNVTTPTIIFDTITSKIYTTQSTNFDGKPGIITSTEKILTMSFNISEEIGTSTSGLSTDFTSDSSSISPYVIFAIVIILAFGVTSLYAFRSASQKIPICGKKTNLASTLRQNARSVSKVCGTKM